MSDAVIIALIVAIPAMLPGIAAVILALKNGRAVEKVHIAINSRMDELLSTTKRAAISEATAAEKERALAERAP